MSAVRTPSPDTSWRNWSRTVTAHPSAVLTPGSVGELSRIVADAADRGQTVKPVGAGHSFSSIAATDGIQVRLDALAGLRRVDPHTRWVTVGGGTRLADLNLLLATQGLALPNLGDIDRQTIAGAISTGTHGSGNRLGGIATQVRALTLVTGDGSVVTCSTEDDPSCWPPPRSVWGPWVWSSR